MATEISRFSDDLISASYTLGQRFPLLPFNLSQNVFTDNQDLLYTATIGLGFACILPLLSLLSALVRSSFETEQSLASVKRLNKCATVERALKTSSGKASKKSRKKKCRVGKGKKRFRRKKDCRKRAISPRVKCRRLDMCALRDDQSIIDYPRQLGDEYYAEVDDFLGSDWTIEQSSTFDQSPSNRGLSEPPQQQIRHLERPAEFSFCDPLSARVERRQCCPLLLDNVSVSIPGCGTLALDLRGHRIVVPRATLEGCPGEEQFGCVGVVGEHVCGLRMRRCR